MKSIPASWEIIEEREGPCRYIHVEVEILLMEFELMNLEEILDNWSLDNLDRNKVEKSKTGTSSGSKK